MLYFKIPTTVFKVDQETTVTLAKKKEIRKLYIKEAYHYSPIAHQSLVAADGMRKKALFTS